MNLQYPVGSHRILQDPVNRISARGRLVPSLLCQTFTTNLGQSLLQASSFPG